MNESSLDHLNSNPPAVTGSPRHDRLIQLVKTNGHMRIDDLALKLDVSSQTVRRDIKKLSDDGLLSRYHGGVGQASSAVNQELVQRAITQMDEKQRIAQVIAERIPDRSTVFMACGTTVEYIAQAMLDVCRELRVITSCLRVANLLYTQRDFDVMIPGGSLRTKDSGIIGASAQEFLRGFRADYFLMSVGAIEPDGTILEYDINEVAVMKIMMNNSKHVWVAADHSKFSASASVALSNTSEIDALFTDEMPPEPLASLLQQQHAELICCPKGSE